MQNPTRKQMQSLAPFSRDHGVGLVCAQQARKAACASQTDRLLLGEQVLAMCRNTIIGYLEDEQWALSPLIGDDSLRASFHERHRNIRSLTHELSAIDLSEHRGLAVLSMLADALDDCVRWEQHTLFVRVEEGIEIEQLQQLTKLTVALEAQRKRPTQQLHRSVDCNRGARKSESLIPFVLGMMLTAVAVNLIITPSWNRSDHWLLGIFRLLTV